MTFTPIDIENQKFDVRMRGYDRDQVARFLAAMAESATALIAEKIRLEEEVGILKRRVEDYQARDKKIQDSLLAIRDLGEKMKEDARRDGDLQVREARHKADLILQEARGEALRIEADLSQLRIERENFESRLRLLVEEHLRILEHRRSEARPMAGVPLVRKGITSADS